jgi:dienelactone hydrolase
MKIFHQTLRIVQRNARELALVLVILAIIYAVNRPAQVRVDLPEMIIQEARLEPLEDNYHPLWLETNRGEIEARYYPASNVQHGVVFAPGAGGGWGEVANGLYWRLCQDLPEEGIACFRLRYRNEDDPLECILDVVAGIRYLESQGINSVALVGNSLGGMIAIYTAVAVPSVRTVVTLSTGGVGDELVASLGPRCSILLIHGTHDSLVSYKTSERLGYAAREPKRLILYKNANHFLRGVAEKVHREVHGWLVEQLRRE